MFLRKWKLGLLAVVLAAALLSLGAKCRVGYEVAGTLVGITCNCPDGNGTCKCNYGKDVAAIRVANALALASDSPNALAPDELPLE